MFRNSQWQVTEDGLEAPGRHSYYVIEARSLPGVDRTTDHYTRSIANVPEGADLYIWPMHMAAKTWIDMPAFIEAFDAALAYHHPGKKNQALFDATAAAANEYLAKARAPAQTQQGLS